MTENPALDGCQTMTNLEFSTRALAIYVEELLRRIRSYDEDAAFALLWQTVVKDGPPPPERRSE